MTAMAALGASRIDVMLATHMQPSQNFNIFPTKTSTALILRPKELQHPICLLAKFVVN
jgi:hypothetical protein